jgi:hypothetical protein
MWEPQRLTTLWASTSCYRDSFTFTQSRIPAVLTGVRTSSQNYSVPKRNPLELGNLCVTQSLHTQNMFFHDHNIYVIKWTYCGRVWPLVIWLLYVFVIYSWVLMMMFQLQISCNIKYVVKKLWVVCSKAFEGVSHDPFWCTSQARALGRVRKI